MLVKITIFHTLPTFYVRVRVWYQNTDILFDMEKLELWGCQKVKIIPRYAYSF